MLNSWPYPESKVIYQMHHCRERSSDLYLVLEDMSFVFLWAIVFSQKIAVTCKNVTLHCGHVNVEMWINHRRIRLIFPFYILAQDLYLLLKCGA